ncbi:chloride channel protein [Thalassotalea sp. M1531]|uniref:Chloride channel protein n=2 Tax=Thalassotalea algicola TaxID=2716224 RepID=A0A7Y0LCY6_9GAMM|nr:chloride channel protein [Thalassotalea algicola]
MPRTSWQLCLLAIIGGLISAFLIVLFIGAINTIQRLLLVDLDHYTSLSELSRFLLPIFGAMMLLVIAWITGYKYVRTGIPFVLHRLKVAYGVIPLRNTINQFFGGIVALASGFSVGKEGPAVHLGAACSGYLGSKLNLPSNATRTLSACGVAAGIAACFNTPIAAVIFVMEVILREYKVHMFIPIMLAAIVGSMVTSTVFGPAHEFEFFSNIALDYEHYPWVVVLGATLGALASIFNRYLVELLRKVQHIHIVKRFLIAGLITGIIGFAIPHAMGTDLSAINYIMGNDSHVLMLVALLIAKCALTITAIGLGIPGGIIGPILGIGAVAGAVTAGVMGVDGLNNQMTSDFALMGMAGFMAATLNAPLAALLAVVELSNQLDIIVPAMLVISASCLCSGQFFRNRSIFIMQLNMQKLAYRKPPLEDSLHRIGVLGAMKTNISVFDAQLADKAIETMIEQDDFLIMYKDGEYYWNEITGNQHQTKRFRQHKLTAISSKDTLAEAYWAVNEQRCGAVYIYDKLPDNIVGIITFEQIRSYLLEGKIS